MEFLGDAVLQIISSDFLFKKYPDILEGKLSKMRSSLVRESALYQCSKAINLGEFIMLGRGEENCGGRTKPSVIADAFEDIASLAGNEAESANGISVVSRAYDESKAYDAGRYKAY